MGMIGDRLDDNDVAGNGRLIASDLGEAGPSQVRPVVLGTLRTLQTHTAGRNGLPYVPSAMPIACAGRMCSYGRRKGRYREVPEIEG